MRETRPDPALGRGDASPSGRRATDDPAELGAAGLRHRHAQGALGARRRRPRCSRCSARTPPSSRRVNGVPWWYFHGLGGPYEGRRLASVDPGDVQWDGIGPRARDRLRRLSGGRGGRARRDRARRGRPLHAGRALGRAAASASSALSEALIAAGLKAPVRAAHPRRDLGQALGQPLLQPDQRADRRHARRDQRRPRHARASPAR